MMCWILFCCYLLMPLFLNPVSLKGTIRLRDIAVVHMRHLPDKNGIVPLCSSVEAVPANFAARIAFSSF